MERMRTGRVAKGSGKSIVATVNYAETRLHSDDPNGKLDKQGETHSHIKVDPIDEALPMINWSDEAREAALEARRAHLKSAGAAAKGGPGAILQRRAAMAKAPNKQDLSGDKGKEATGMAEEVAKDKDVGRAARHHNDPGMMTKAKAASAGRSVKQQQTVEEGDKGRSNYASLSDKEKKQYNKDWAAAHKSSKFADKNPSKQSHAAAAAAHQQAAKSAPSNKAYHHKIQAHVHAAHAKNNPNQPRADKHQRASQQHHLRMASYVKSAKPKTKKAGPVEKQAKRGGPASSKVKAKAKAFVSKQNKAA